MIGVIDSRKSSVDFHEIWFSKRLNNDAFKFDPLAT
jgi:hypothetical protein